MANNRYQIEVVKAGFSAHTAIVTFKFIGDNSYYDNPEEIPVEDLELVLQLNVRNDAGTAYDTLVLGTLEMAKFSTLDDYYLTIPYDFPSNASMGNAAYCYFRGHPQEGSGKNYSVAFRLPNGQGSSGSIRIDFSYEAAPLSFSSLNTRFTYCPDGNCAELGLNS